MHVIFKIPRLFKRVIFCLCCCVIYLTVIPGCERRLTGVENQEQTESVNPKHQGLIGAWYHGGDLTRIGTSSRIDSLNQVWDGMTGHGSDWSAQWVGWIKAPATGEVTFYGETSHELGIRVVNAQLVQLKGDKGDNGRIMHMVRNAVYPIQVVYQHRRAGQGYFKGYWSYSGQEKQVIPYGIRMKVSQDQGQTWGRETVLRSDGRNWDLGYPRLVIRPDGNLLALYYFTTQVQPEQHIAFSLFNPNQIN